MVQVPFCRQSGYGDTAPRRVSFRHHSQTGSSLALSALDQSTYYMSYRRLVLNKRSTLMLGKEFNEADLRCTRHSEPPGHVFPPSFYAPCTCTSPPVSLRRQLKLDALALIPVLSGVPPKIKSGEGFDYDPLVKKVVKSVGEKMVQVAMAAIAALEVLAIGLGPAVFSKHAKPSAKVLLRRTKEKKVVALVLSCLGCMYSTGALNLKAIMEPITEAVHPPKKTDKKVPHSQCAAIEFIESCLRNKDVAWDSANSVAVVDICVKAMGPTYDTKVRAAASDLAALVIARSKAEVSLERSGSDADGTALSMVQLKLKDLEESNKMAYKAVIEKSEELVAIFK